ncbi:SlyX family protein [Chiayiivirga flava]|uniref:Protein SlyX homolog n=1 Tax=Chiayiivirga flava TaxID=659595 RepID=A0A7W8D4Q8_9GAMM|nr:SlyX family protein [Chiayiivirga flava]MBB5206656.1 SlyX protein [Chiayiivirga flava]
MDNEPRWIELETRLAFQEHTLGELSRIVHEQRIDIDALRLRLDRALSDLGSLRDSLAGDAAPEPPPPHY